MSPTKEDMILTAIQRIESRLDTSFQNGCTHGQITRIKVEEVERKTEILEDRPGRWLGYIATSASIVAVIVAIWGAKRDANEARNQWHKQAATEAHP